MPNQSDPNQPVTNVPQTAATPPTIPDFQAADIPSAPPENTQPVAGIESVVSSADSSTFAPPDIPPIISPTPKKKFGGGKIIATILGFLILIGGIAGGVILTQQRQEIREKAYTYGGAGKDTCNLVTWSVTENINCPRLYDQQGTNNVAVHKADYTLTNQTNGLITVQYRLITCFCLEPYGVDTPGNPYACNYNCRTETQEASFQPNQSKVLTAERASDYGVACGSYQTDLYIDSVNNDTNCHSEIDGTKLAAATACQTGMVCPSLSPSPSPTSTPGPTASPTSTPGPTASPTPAGSSCKVCGGITGATCPSGEVCIYADGSTRAPSPDATGTCQQQLKIPITCGGFTGASCPANMICTYSDGSTNPPYPDASGICQINCVKPTTPPLIAQCLDIKAYTPTWGLISAVQLTQLKAGDKVNFCVRGGMASPSGTGSSSEPSGAGSGDFDKAQFTINGNIQAETIRVRPGSTDEFCQMYQVPVGRTTFEINAKIHHVTLGWF